MDRNSSIHYRLVMHHLPLSEVELDLAFRALADPTRRAILTRLTAGEAGVLEVAASFSMSQPAVTKHLHVLERAGLISRRRDARRRPCRLEPDRLGQISDWVGSYSQFWEHGFERLDGYISDLQADAREQ